MAMLSVPIKMQGRIETNFPLAKLSSWKVGGLAEVYVEPKGFSELMAVLNWVKNEGLSLFVLGKGSNVLISDGGVPGVTLRIFNKNFSGWSVSDDKLTVEAGTSLPALSRIAADLGFSGYEHLIGIPGTVGAGVVINAGTSSGKDMSSIVSSVKYLDGNLCERTLTNEGMKFSYRSSILKNTHSIVLEVTFNLNSKGDSQEIKNEHTRIISERKIKYPLEHPNCGSVFKNSQNGKRAWKVIEDVGLKGFKIGDAQVSNKHANFIVNLGNATATNIKDLILYVQEKVHQETGLCLEREVLFIPEESNWK